jgi:CubicO group peptidase (beta-lactamase class C family)
MRALLRGYWPWALVAVAVAILAVAAVLLAARERAPAAPPEPDYWPTHGWRASTPEEQGFDSGKLAEVVLAVREAGLNIHSLMVIRHGYVILDAYFYPYDGQTTHDMASVTKSLMTSLIGIADHQGHLDLDQPMLSFFPDRQIANLEIRKEQITVRHLAGMANGMESTGMAGNEATHQAMQASGDWVQFALDRKMVADPGTQFVYDSPGMHLLSPILQQATGATALDYARQNLFEPLGIQNVIWLTDPQGYNGGSGDSFLHPRDAAKIGFLWLHQGKWEGQQIVSREWVQESVTRQLATGMSEDYGYGWWVVTESEVGGWYMASGRGGQRIQVLPALDIILVTTGGGFDPGEATDMLATAVIDLEKPLPPNPAGSAQLEAALAALQQPPPAQPVPPPPETAQAISGATYTLEPNPLHVASLRLDFDDSAEAAFAITFDIDQPPRSGPIGLDGVYRFSPGSCDLPVGRHGHWLDAQTFVLEEDQVAFNHAYTFNLRFEADRVTVEVIERGAESGVVVSGRAASP